MPPSLLSLEGGQFVHEAVHRDDVGGVTGRVLDDLAVRQASAQGVDHGMEEGGGASTLDQQDRGLQAAEPFGVLAGYERSDVAQEGPAVLDPQRPLRQTPWVHTGRGYPDHPDELIQLVLADIAPGLLARSPQRLETRIIGRMVQSPERRRIDQREGPDPVRLVQGITEGGAAPKDHATMSNGPLGTASSRVAFRAPASVRSE